MTGTKAKGPETRLHRLVIGQEEAIDEIVRTYQTYLAGLSPNGRPIGRFLFLGPTGTGKTRAVAATAEALLGNPCAVTRIDCGEFQHSHEIAKLIGSMLSQDALSQYQTETPKVTFVLFDEIEKASDTLWNLLLGILDNATLTLGDNRKVDLSNALIFMTSNIGAAEMSSLVSPKPGFHVSTPEFLNRLDKIVVFRALGDEEIANATRSPRKLLLTEGAGPSYGARIRVTHNGKSPSVTFFPETEAWDIWKTNGAAA